MKTSSFRDGLIGVIPPPANTAAIPSFGATQQSEANTLHMTHPEPRRTMPAMTNQTSSATSTSPIENEWRDKRISQLDQEMDFLFCFSLVNFLLILGYMAFHYWANVK